MTNKLQDIQPTYHYTIGIDPDVEKSGVAVVEKETRRIECAALTFPQTLDYLQWVAKRAAETGATVKVYVEAGWLNQSNWHVRREDGKAVVAKKGVSQGRNEEVSRLLGEMCEHYGLDWYWQKPLEKHWKGAGGKITHAELCRITGMIYGRTNQEMRDAALIAWVKASIPRNKYKPL